ncbi:MAG: LutC/YkgG family protein, partial [Hyphomicrobium sp.]
MSRAAILANVRSALKVEARHEAERRASVEARLAQGAHHLVPARGKVSAEERVALFKSFLGAQGTDVIEVTAAAEIPAAIAVYLGGRNLPLRVRVGA